MNDDEVIVVPIEDSIDLHTFRPEEVSSLLMDYFQACLEKGIKEVRVIHGKGTGQLRAGVLSFLETCSLVKSYSPAPPERGGWGATIVKLAGR
ncbi:MAG: Smr/MutS family protein [Deltaproteobacteria bacterium]|nr:Smr/MutS family protein [Deltaproteobacteria bacterium]MBW2084844.1 Smr/MutS family protein [Deltaproteobacteria bacterium]